MSPPPWCRAPAKRPPACSMPAPIGSDACGKPCSDCRPTCPRTPLQFPNDRPNTIQQGGLSDWGIRYIPELMLDDAIPKHKDFLEERRKPKALKIKKWFDV